MIQSHISHVGSWISTPKLASGRSKGVETGSTGKSYYLKANCGSTDMELPLSRRLTNSSGSFAFSTTNVW